MRACARCRALAAAAAANTAAVSASADWRLSFKLINTRNFRGDINNAPGENVLVPFWAHIHTTNVVIHILRYM